MKLIQKTLGILAIVMHGITLQAKNSESAVFAMGCFWCAEAEFRNHETGQPLSGITSLSVGYAGGTLPNPTYDNHNGYKEALKITFDPAVISYDQLLYIFWHNIDLFDDQGQFCDQGPSYTTAVFYMNETQKTQANDFKNAIQKLYNQPIKTDIEKYTTFYPAEEIHQNYKGKNPYHYKLYRWNCGRDKKLREIWDEKRTSNKHFLTLVRLSEI